ncbi:MAG: hypothetical protein IPK26_16805 [Planctomycetes bacterium]|nr:hypothetical protein [Planctomycetota bacterium]
MVCTLLGVLLLGNGEPSPRRHDLAFVNDSRSHGQVGDLLLSLNEVIQLHNRTLLQTQLSLFEQAQLGGGGLDITFCEIDSANVPVITVERDLDVILDMLHGFEINGGGLPPVIDFSGPGLQHGFRSQSNRCNWTNLRLVGGPIGIDIALAVPATANGGTRLSNMEFVGQTQTAVQVVCPAQAALRLLMDRCEFHNAPVGLQIDERGAGCTNTLIAVDNRMTGVGIGVDIAVGDGGLGNFELDRLDCTATAVGVRLQRPNGGNRPVVFAGTQSELRAPQALVLDTVATGSTTVALRMMTLIGTGNGAALLGGAPNGRWSGTVDELVSDGGVGIQCGAGSSLAITNGRLRNGIVAIDNSGGQVRLRDCRLDASAVVTLGSTAVRFDECCVLAPTIQGSAAAPLSCSESYVQGAATNVQQQNPRPAPQLGSFSVLPADVRIGGPLQYQANLPSGLFGVFTLGFSVDPTALVLLPYPLHVYSDLAATATLPGIWQSQQSHPIAIPNDPLLVGSDFTAQMAVFAGAGVAAPWLNLPPGRRFVLR